MTKIPYTYRRKHGCYRYRRAVCLPKFGKFHITCSLGTSIASLARVRAAAVTAALDRVVAMLHYHSFQIGVRSASEANLLLKQVTDFTIGIATQGYFDPVVSPELVSASCLVNADLHDLAARHEGCAILDKADEIRLRDQGRDDVHMRRLRQLISAEGDGLLLSDMSLQQRLEHLGIAGRPGALKQDRLLMHRGIRDGQLRATRFNDPEVVASGDPLGYLVELGGALIARGDQPTTPGIEVADAEVASSAVSASPMLGTLIDGIVNDLIAKDAWSEGVGEDGRRLVKQFVWMVGDMPCLDYRQMHVSEFVRELWQIPKTVRVQSVWDRPYSSVRKSLGLVTAHNRRSKKTLNKDLAYLASFTNQMVAAGYWPEDFIRPLKLTATVTVQEKDSGRLPWRPVHLETMFNAPIYRGNRGSKRRLACGEDVYHDSAYWLPLLACYQLGRRDEHAGHLVSDFVFDIGTPHMLIEENLNRTLKSANSERVLPLHPRLLELGFQEFVEAARAAGEISLFPELWLNAGKKGGDQYYSVSWRKLMGWLEQQSGIAIPATPSGKKADFHSIRATGLSQLDRNDINQYIVCDLAGHGREGTTARSYQKLLQSGGLEDVLQERLKVLQRLPDYAATVSRQPLKILPIPLRAR